MSASDINSTHSSNNGNTRTILRIKRRRTEEPLPYIRLEGLDGRPRRRDDRDNAAESTSVDEQVDDLLDSVSQESSLQDDETGSGSPRRQKRSTAVWRRLSLEEDAHRSYKIVDAVLEGDGRAAKRRRLTLLDTSSSTTTTASDRPSPKFPQLSSFNGSDCSGTSVVRRKTALIKVLDPLSRMVDDSLQLVHSGSKGVDEHFRFVTTDPSLEHESKKWLAWCHSSGGNILHACALWNDVEVASAVLGQQLSPMMAKLTEAVDEDGRTPYEVAQLSGHDSVCQVLESFGGDTTNYVYDIFCLEEGKEDDFMSSEFDNGDADDVDMTVELRGGVGYWTPEGELVLEAPEKSSALSLTHVFDDDDIDSNCEEYGANDYPDEDEGAVSWNDNDGHEGGDAHYHMGSMGDAIRRDQFHRDEIYSNEEYDYDAMVNGI